MGRVPSSDKKPTENNCHTMFKQKGSPAGKGEPLGPPPKKRYTMNMASNKSLEAAAKAKEEGAPVGPKAQEGMTEGGSKSPNVYGQKYAQKQPKPGAGDAFFPSPRDAQPDNSLRRKDGTSATVSRARVSSAHSAGTANAPAAPSMEAGPRANPDLTNHEIKCALMTEIRRYGRQYGRIFKLLEEVQGPLAVKIQFVEFTIKEAARFKRRHLINYLEKILKKLMSERSLNNDRSQDV